MSCKGEKKLSKAPLLISKLAKPKAKENVGIVLETKVKNNDILISTMTIYVETKQFYKSDMKLGW